MKRILIAIITALPLLVSCDLITDITNQEKGGNYSNLDLQDYPEWDAGVITKDNTYLLVKQDTLTNGYVGYLNNSDIDDKGVALYFDHNITLTSFVTEKGSCALYWKSSDIADIHVITNTSDNIYENVSMTSYMPASTRTAWEPVILAVAKGASAALTIGSAAEGLAAMFDGDFEATCRNALELICGEVSDKVFKHTLDYAAIDAALAGYDKLMKELTEKGQLMYLGDCRVSMKSVKTWINTYKLDVTVTGYETIPVIDQSSGAKCEVVCGIAARKGSDVSYSKNDLIIDEFIVDGNGTKSFEFELPEGSGYTVVPYLIATGHTSFPADYVRYGNKVQLEGNAGYIDEFRQMSHTRNGDKYTFKCYVYAICNQVIDKVYWQVYYEDHNETKVFVSQKNYSEPAVSRGLAIVNEFEFEIEIGAERFDDGKEEIKLGIATFDESNELLLESYPQIFELATEFDRWVDLGLPSGILWAAYNVDANSPEESGGYYAWGETEEKSSYTWDNYEHSYPDDVAIWTGAYIGEEISGTSYDVAHVKWGDGARMPTFEEVKELVLNCTFKYGTYNEIKGDYAIGPNGKSIFLPFAGSWNNNELLYEGQFGHFWSGTYDNIWSGDIEYGEYAFGLTCDSHCYVNCEDIYLSTAWWGNWGILRYPGIPVRPVKNK